MVTKERIKRIVEILKENEIISVKELSLLLNVSTMTINRDLKFLESNNFLSRFHGGAELKKNNIEEILFNERMNSHLDEKKKIAIKAVTFIQDNDSIILDGSTTSIILSKELSKKNLSNLTVITNSHYIIDELKTMKDICLISTGGEYLNKFGSLIGNYALMILSRIRANKIFFSVGGVSIEEGLTDANLAEIKIKNQMFEIVREKTLLVASHKFNKVLTHQVAPLDIVDRIITESIDKNLQNKLEALKISVEIA
jgi:DeoR family transcriptional regulator, fructose operon transcriptional repressor